MTNAGHEPQDVVRGRAAQPSTRDEMPVIGPGAPPPPPPPSPPAATGPVRWGVLGDISRAGRWAVPPKQTFVLLMGDVNLDLRKAQFSGPVAQFTVYSVLGDVDVLIPEGMDVEVIGGQLLGDVSMDVRRDPDQPHPRVVIKAYGLFGDVKVVTATGDRKLPRRWRRRDAR